MQASTTISHLPFFQALAEQPNETTPGWRQTSAGLLALRLYDAWARQARRNDPASEPLRVALVRAEVEAVDEGSTVRGVLLGLVDAMVRAPRRPDVVRGHVLAYAKRLQFDAQWRLAADVYRTAVESREPYDLTREAQEAAFQCGYCFRMAGELDEAATAYDVGEAIATAANDTFGMLRARVAKAKLTIHRGNLPLAEKQLDAVIRAAEETSCTRALSLALTDRMAVAGQRGRFEEAAVFGYRALRHCEDELEREPILSDIATALGDAGHTQAARDAHLVLSVSARDPRVRSLSALNLLELSLVDGNELEFERCRRTLADAPLPVDARAKYHLVVGDGHRQFGHAGLATTAYRTALAFAEEHQVNDILLKAEAALVALQRAPLRVSAAEDATVGAVVTILDVIRAMRELRDTAGAGGR